MPEKSVFTWYRNHFDLAWRRGWQRSHEGRGGTYLGYAELQRLILRRYLELAGRGAVFELEQTLSVRDALRHDPELFSLLRQAGEIGRFRMVGCGESIIDINQCHGETMIRNFVTGTLFTREELGHMPLVAGRFDGFGASAQLPQVVRGCGYRWVTGFSYAKPDNLYWRGLDGTAILVLNEEDFPGTSYFYDHCYYEPCAGCGGSGKRPDRLPCPDCDGTRLRREAGTYPPREDPELPEDLSFGIYWVRSEEMLPDPGLLDQVARFNAKGMNTRMVWGTLESIVPYLQDQLDAADSPSPDKVASAVEWNPTQTGTLVTRARLKRLARAAERTFFSTERYFALRSLAGLTPPTAALEELWLALPLLFFHDVITGTLADAAAEEMEELACTTARKAADLAGHPLYHAPCDSSPDLAVFNPDASGFPIEVMLPDRAADGELVQRPSGERVLIYPAVRREAFAAAPLHALGSDRCLRPTVQYRTLLVGPVPLQIERLARTAEDASLRVKPAKAGTAANETFEITWDERGLRSIRDRVSGRFLSNHPSIRPNTLLLEEDIGDPWGTRSFQRSRMEIYHNTELTFVLENEALTEIAFAGIFRENLTFARERDPNVFGLEWTQTVRLWKSSPRIDFVTEIYWKSANRRIRVAFPTPTECDDGWYGIPGGYLRRPRYEMQDTRLYSPNGDWPALDFFSTVPGDAPGVALLNRGAVSARVEEGVMLLSLLRSPGFGSCLERYAQDYPMAYEGIRDGGYHTFEYALTALHGEQELPRLAAHAAAYNARPLCLPPSAEELPALRFEPAELHVLALKPAFKAEGIIVRVLNNSGRPTDAVMRLPGCVARAQRCSFLEEPAGLLPITDKCLRFRMRGWEIATLQLSLQHPSPA